METKEQKITVETLYATVEVLKDHIDTKVKSVTKDIDKTIAEEVKKATEGLDGDTANRDEVIQKVRDILNGKTEE